MQGADQSQRAEEASRIVLRLQQLLGGDEDEDDDDDSSGEEEDMNGHVHHIQE